MGHCFRLPYNIIILAAGHYKQTQNNYIIAALGNLIISILLVPKFNLLGIAIGAAFALYYQTIWMAYYVYKNIIKWPIIAFVKQFGVDFITLMLGGYLSFFIVIDINSYYDWLFMSARAFLLWMFCILLINSIFYRDKINCIKNCTKILENSH